MFGRVTQHTLAQGSGRLKSHVAGVYTHGKHFASMLDNAVQVGTEIAAGLKGAYAVGGQLARVGATILPLII